MDDDHHTTANDDGDMTAPTNDNNDESQPSLPDDEPPRDDEGLLWKYDVVLCGTGLVQSILASALTRAGKTVLHCDGADSYGEMDAVWTFGMIDDMMKEANGRSAVPPVEEDFSCISSETMWRLSPKGGMASLEFHSQHTTKYLGIQQGTEVKSPYGAAIVRSIQRLPSPRQISLQLELKDWKLANKISPIVYINFTTNDDALEHDPARLEEYLDTHSQICSTKSKQGQHLLTQQRFFALDATPACVLASGQAVMGMLASNVADYLEFKSVEGLYWLEHSETTRTTTTSSQGTFELSRVPCSKNDVFGTRLLQPMDKRRLMKFIQVSMDYATKMAVAEELQDAVVEDPVLPESEVQSLNERHLNQGRSLARPQNKAVATNELQILEQAIESGDLTFEEFLTQHYKLSPKLRSIVRYALAWETKDSSTSLAQGMSMLRQHLQALGRYGTTAFLVPMYGSGELSQAFCRSAAVFGATYLLRRAPLAIQHNADKTVTGILISGDKTDDDSAAFMAKRNVENKVVKCDHVVVPNNVLLDEDMSTGKCERRIVRRLTILLGKVIPSENGEQRHIIFIPPNAIGNSYAIHAVLLDFSARAAPNECTLLHLTTTVPATRCTSNIAADSEDFAAVLQRAQDAILSSKRQGAGDVSAGGNDKEHYLAKELYHVSFSHACPENETSTHSSGLGGLHVCSHMGQSLTADVAFQEAQRLFSTICPGMEFLGLANTFDEAIRARAEEKRYDDDEKTMLESALGMIEDPNRNNGESFPDILM
jgi:RAB protein geranylgeranyltransferase component A